MPRWVDLTNERFGRLRVTSYVGINPDNNGAVWNVICDCGTVKMIASKNLRSSRGTQSCGCLQRERVGDRARTHGRSGSPEYRIWSAMIERCHNENNKHFKNYGGRGIIVCDRWRESFANFFADMGERPSTKLTIERKTNDGPYSPENCVWETRAKQSRNHRRNVSLTLCGRTQVITDWAKEIGISVQGLQSRIAHGWSEEDIITPSDRESNRSAPPRQPEKTYTALGKTQTIKQWIAETGLSRTVLNNRIKSGWPMDFVMSTPLSKGKRTITKSMKPPE